MKRDSSLVDIALPPHCLLLLHLHLGALAPEKREHLRAGLHILVTNPHVEENGLEGVCVHAPLIVVGCGLLVFHLPCISLANRTLLGNLGNVGNFSKSYSLLPGHLQVLAAIIAQQGRCQR